MAVAGKRARLIIAGGAVTTLIAGMSQVAVADPPSSTLVAAPTSLTFDIGGTTSGPVTADLDSGCGQALNNGQSYVVDAVSGNTAVATVSPAESAAKHCADAAVSFTVSTVAWNPAVDANNTAACAAVGATSITLTPVTGAPGQQAKIHGTSVGVTVTDTGALCGDGGGGGGGVGDEHPAAPAVANGDLNTNAALAAACKSHFGNKNSWRGSTIKAVADQMPKPESVKDDETLYPGTAWEEYVFGLVSAICGYNPV